MAATSGTMQPPGVGTYFLALAQGMGKYVNALVTLQLAVFNALRQEAALNTAS